VCGQESRLSTAIRRNERGDDDDTTVTPPPLAPNRPIRVVSFLGSGTVLPGLPLRPVCRGLGLVQFGKRRVDLL
jgi:hypothetical protein